MTQSWTSTVARKTSVKIKCATSALLLAGMIALPAETLIGTASASPRASVASPHHRFPTDLGSRRTVKPGEAVTLSPQPLPPGGRFTIKPGDAVTLNPQPLPPRFGR